MGKFNNILLASDLDDTLYNRAKQISPLNLTAIENFIEQGGRFTVATGRAMQAFETPRGQIPINAPVILANGALIHDYGSGQSIYTRSLEGDYLSVCASARRAFPEIAVEAHLMEGIWVTGFNGSSAAHLHSVKVQGHVVETLEEIPDNWLKALYVAEESVLRAVYDWFIPRYSDKYDLVFSHSNLLEMQHKDANKGSGLLRLANILSIPHERVFSAGDQQNDVSMLRAVTSFAPENATEEAKAAARYIVSDCDHDTIAAAIAKIAELL
jgi:Cof subfamily protein (haloacid dehalogenase superfamily)